MWIGYAVYCLAFGAWGLLGLLGQAIIIAHLRRYRHTTDGGAGDSLEG